MVTLADLEKEVRRHVQGAVEFFFPMVVESKDKKIQDLRVLIDGYLFVHVVPTEVSFHAMTDTMLFEGLLCEDDRPCIIPDSEIQKLKAQVDELNIRNLATRTKVKIVDGLYKNLEGEIISIDRDKGRAKVIIKLYSKNVEEEIPVSFLEELPSGSVLAKGDTPP